MNKNKMEERRLELHEQLVSILGSNNVYYQPPSTVSMKYPAITYSRKTINNIHANDEVYNQTREYQITVIDKDPDSVIVNKMSLVKRIKHVRHYSSDNLNHDVFNLHY